MLLPWTDVIAAQMFPASAEQGYVIEGLFREIALCPSGAGERWLNTHGSEQKFQALSQELCGFEELHQALRELLVKFMWFLLAMRN